MAINQAMELAARTGNLPVPLHLRNAPTKLMEEIGYGKGYKYSHDYEGSFAQQQYLPDEIKNTIFYQPKEIAKEQELLKKLQAQWAKKYNRRDH